MLKMGVWTLLAVLVAAGAGLCLLLIVSLDEGRGSAPAPSLAEADTWSGIVLPALGRPALLDTRDSQPFVIEAMLALPGNEAGDGEGLSARLVPLSAAEEVIPLVVRHLAPATSRDIEQQGLSPWVIEHTSGLVRARLEVLPSVAGRPIRNLYDLEVRAGDRVFTASSAVFLSPGLSEEAGLIVASDVHVATRWDEIERDVERLFPEGRPGASTPEAAPPPIWDDLVSAATFRSTFLNPNKVFCDFIRKTNEMFDRGEIDAVLLLGDLVDYKFQRPRRHSGLDYEDTEWALFERIVLGRYPGAQRLRAPLFTSTGNHDYRLYPYSIQVYGLRHCGVPDVFTEEYLRRSGTYRRPAYRLSDLDAVRINTGAAHSLDCYFRRLNPSLDYSLVLGGVRSLVLDSGPDAFCRAAEHLSSRRGGDFLSGLLHAMEQPNSNGLTDGQRALVSDFFAGAEATSARLLFTHAPFLNNGPANSFFPSPGKEGALGVTAGLTGAITLRRALAFERDLSRKGLSVSTLFRNQLPALAAMAGSAGPAAAFAGHVHHEVEFAVGRRDGAVTYGAYSSSSDLVELLRTRVLLLSGAALGHLERSYQEGAVPSFRLLRLAHGSLEEVTRQPIARYQVFAHVRVESAPGTETVEFSFEAPGAEASPEQFRHRIAVFLLDRRNQPLAKMPDPMRVEPVNPGDVMDRSSTRTPGAVSESFVVSGLSHTTLRIAGRSGGVRAALLSESFRRVDDGWQSLGLVWHPQALK